MNKSPALRREIKKIKDNQNEVVVFFKNHSTITVVPASENGRGYRSNVIVREEFRQIKKSIDDSILSPFQIVRQVPYLQDEFYKDVPELQEETIDIYISSSWYDNGENWMWDIVDKAFDEMMAGEPSCLLAFDESVAICHKIKTLRYFQSEKKKQDPMTWKLEFLNYRLKESSMAFFRRSLFENNQNSKLPWYPRFDVDVLTGRKNPYDIVKQPEEIRVVSCDMAFVTGSGNDNSIFTCGRLLPETNQNGIASYRVQIPYMEGRQGGETQSQAIRIRQLFEDFNADYIVLDVRNAGIAIYDHLSKIMYDQERQREYSALSCMNDESIAARNRTDGTNPCIYAVNASQKLNSDIALTFRRMLTEGMIDFLIPMQKAQEEVLNKNKEYLSTPDADVQVFFERPFLETQALISESCALTYEKKEGTGVIVVKEQGKNQKDRYTSASYLVYFANELSRDLLNIREDYEYEVFIN